MWNNNSIHVAVMKQFLVKNQERLQMVLALPMSNDVKWCSGVIIVKT